VFFCEEEGEERLRHAATDQLHNRIMRCAQLLNDTLILAKLSTGHMSAREQKYHPSCLCDFYHKANRIDTTMTTPNTDKKNNHQLTPSLLH